MTNSARLESFLLGCWHSGRRVQLEDSVAWRDLEREMRCYCFQPFVIALLLVWKHLDTRNPNPYFTQTNDASVVSDL